MDDEGLELLKLFVERHARTYDSPYCPECQSADPDPHAEDCLWWRARAYLRDQGIEVEDVE